MDSEDPYSFTKFETVEEYDKYITDKLKKEKPELFEEDNEWLFYYFFSFTMISQII